MADVPAGGVPVNGQFYATQDLTFRERMELRQAVRDCMGNQTAEIYDAVDQMDWVLPLRWIIKRRIDKDAKLEAEFLMKPSDLQAEFMATAKALGMTVDGEDPVPPTDEAPGSE